MEEKVFDYALKQYLIMRGIASNIFKSGDVKSRSKYIYNALQRDGVTRDGMEAARVCRELAVSKAAYVHRLDPYLDTYDAEELLAWLTDYTRNYKETGR